MYLAKKLCNTNFLVYSNHNQLLLSFLISAPHSVFTCIVTWIVSLLSLSCHCSSLWYQLCAFVKNCHYKKEKNIKSLRWHLLPTLGVKQKTFPLQNELMGNNNASRISMEVSYSIWMLNLDTSVFTGLNFFILQSRFYS